MMPSDTMARSFDVLLSKAMARSPENDAVNKRGSLLPDGAFRIIGLALVSLITISPAGSLTYIDTVKAFGSLSLSVAIIKSGSLLHYDALYSSGSLPCHETIRSCLALARLM